MFRLALALMLAATSAPAQTAVRIKLGTLAPQGSTWHQQMVSMAQDFSKASSGKVELKIYAGGTQGNEGEMIRKMSIGQLHAAGQNGIPCAFVVGGDGKITYIGNPLGHEELVAAVDAALKAAQPAAKPTSETKPQQPKPKG